MHSRGERKKGQPRDRLDVVRRWTLSVVGLGLLTSVAVYAWTRPGSEAPRLLQEGENALYAGRFDEAIASFSRIGPDEVLHPEAQERIARATSMKAAAQEASQERSADVLYRLITTLRKDYVDRAGPTSPLYVPYCRFLLKQARRFVETCPDDPRVVEVKGLFPYYATVVPDPDAPPTEADVRAEVALRVASRQFGQAVAVIDEYAAQSEQAARTAESIRDELRAEALQAWDATKSVLRSEGTLDAEDQCSNWSRLLSHTQRYLDSVEGLSGVADEAQALQDRALQHVRLVPGG